MCIRDSSQAYEEVWYFAAPAVAAVLRDLAANAIRQNVHVHEYVPGSTRRLGL